VGHSIGPFENQSEYKAFVKTMKYVQLITVRDSLSLKCLKNMKLKSARIELTVNPAFCLEPDMEKVEKTFKIYNIPREKNSCGVAPSQGITYYSRTSYQSHFNTLGKLVGFYSSTCLSLPAIISYTAHLHCA
jgi:hypothetical protein